MKVVRIAVTALAFLCSGFFGVTDAQSTPPCAGGTSEGLCTLPGVYSEYSECTGGAALDPTKKMMIRYWVRCPAGHGPVSSTLSADYEFFDEAHPEEGWLRRFSRGLRSSDPEVAVRSSCWRQYLCDTDEPEGLVSGENFVLQGWITVRRGERCVAPIQLKQYLIGPKTSIAHVNVFYGWPSGCDKPPLPPQPPWQYDPA